MRKLRAMTVDEKAFEKEHFQLFLLVLPENFLRKKPHCQHDDFET